MRCLNPEIGKLLLLYALRKLPPPLEDRVRAHLQECDACVEDLMTLHRAGSFFSRYVDEHPDEVDSAARVLRRRRRRTTLISVAALLVCAAVSFLVGRGLATSRAPPGPAAEAAELGVAPGTPRAFLIAAAGEMAQSRARRAEMLLEWAAEWLENPTGPLFESLLARATVEVRLGRRDRALATLRRAAALTETTNDPAGTVQALVRSARILVLGALEPVRASAVLAEARSAAERTGVALAQALVEEMMLLMALVVSADLDLADEIARRIGELAAASPDDAALHGVAQEALGVVGEARFAAGRGDEESLARARDVYADAVRTWEKLEDADGEARARLALGRIALLSGKPEAARPPLRAAANLFQAQGDLRGMALARANLALAELERGDFAEALRTLELPLAEAERSDDPLLRFDLLVLKGRALLRMEKPEEGRAVLRRALEGGEKLYATGRRAEEIAGVSRLVAGAGPDEVSLPRRVVASGIY